MRTPLTSKSWEGKKLPFAAGLPQTKAARLGRIVMRCAQVEYCLLLILKRLQGMSLQDALLLTETIGWKKTVGRIKTAAKVHEFAFTVDIDNLHNRIDSAEKRRNLLVHAPMWIESKQLCMFDTRGEANIIKPARYVANSAFFDESARMIGSVLKTLQQAEKETRALLKTSRPTSSVVSLRP